MASAAHPTLRTPDDRQQVYDAMEEWLRGYTVVASEDS